MNDLEMRAGLFQATGKAQSRWPQVGAAVCAIVVAAALFGGYQYLRMKHLQRTRTAQTTDQVSKVPPVAEAQIFEDEARLKGAEALLGGTVRNISRAALEGLTLEMELKKRSAQETELRQIMIEPENLQPGEAGHYKLSLPSSLWSGARIVKLTSRKRGADIAFKSEPGERRPAERLSSAPKVIVVPRPKPTGEEFINTPDNPTRIP